MPPNKLVSFNPFNVHKTTLIQCTCSSLIQQLHKSGYNVFFVVFTQL